MKKFAFALLAFLLVLPLGASALLLPAATGQSETSEVAAPITDWELLTFVSDPDDGSLLGIWFDSIGEQFGVTDTVIMLSSADGEAETMETSWTSHNGKLTHKVTTPKGDETTEAWAKRHKKAVDALMKLFPADSEEPSDQAGDEVLPDYLSSFAS